MRPSGRIFCICIRLGLWSGFPECMRENALFSFASKSLRQRVRAREKGMTMHDTNCCDNLDRKTFCFGGASLFLSFILNGEAVVRDRETQGEVNADKSVAKRLELANRRYIGCKQKLLDWIFEKISEASPSAKSFFDVFAGTGVVAERALDQGFSQVIVNDLLYSNGVIYEGFFGPGKVSDKKLRKIAAIYNSADVSALPENYFSENYGGKYFECDLSKWIGFIREDIEKRGAGLTTKERAVLLASLIYSIDAHANTCGHFEAYIKKPIPKKDFAFRLIDYRVCDSVRIYREDSNVLAEKVVADVAYIDPPYNSRQYSRFYHVYETLVKWDKPELHGEARKPDAENMSEYCRKGAPAAFADLVRKLRCRCLVVSYNNTYDSKSKSSKNKITLEQIRAVLDSVGKTTVYSRKFAFFNAGKTDFDDHREYLFVTMKDPKRTMYLRSPFFYVGDKFKLLPSIVPAFPTDIDTFVEPFVGGGSVFLNVRANRYLLNDIDGNMIDLHRHLCAQSGRADAWLSELSDLIHQYGLSRSFEEDIVPDEMKKEFVKTYFARFNKEGFSRLRADYNAAKDRRSKYSLDRLYLLLIYGFNRMLRYNSKGDFNLPVGNVDFNPNVVEALRGYLRTVDSMDAKFSALHFTEFMRNLHLTKHDFVYCDPPYLITESEYNKIWHDADDLELMRALDDLDAHGIRFAISNVTHYRGRVNQAFLDWSRKYRVIPIKSNYINYHDNSEKLINEVLVVNYEKM